MADAIPGHSIYRDMPPTIFEKMSARARETGAIKLRQGLSESDGPEDFLRAAAGPVPDEAAARLGTFRLAHAGTDG